MSDASSQDVGDYLASLPYHDRYASGREGDWFPIGLTSARAVRIKELDDVNLDAVAELAQRAAALTKAGQFAM